jgi:hypothetical protein
MLPVSQFIVDEIVKGKYTAHQRSQVNNQHLIISLDVEGGSESLLRNIWQQVENVLQVVDDLVVDRETIGSNLIEMHFFLIF